MTCPRYGYAAGIFKAENGRRNVAQTWRHEHLQTLAFAGLSLTAMISREHRTGDGLERLRVEHPVDVALPGSVIEGEEAVGRGTTVFDRFDQRRKRLAFVLAFSVKTRPAL